MSTVEELKAEASQVMTRTKLEETRLRAQNEPCDRDKIFTQYTCELWQMEDLQWLQRCDASQKFRLMARRAYSRGRECGPFAQNKMREAKMQEDFRDVISAAFTEFQSTLPHGETFIEHLLKTLSARSPSSRPPTPNPPNPNSELRTPNS